jgi:hypothetical protein
MDNTETLILTFKKPFKFEGKEYTEVDLSAMEDWTGDDLIRLTKKYNKLSGGEGDGSPTSVILPESDIEYDMFVAAEATGLPLEFFHTLPAREIGTLKTLVIGFFLG